MILNNKEKEELIIKLLNEGLRFRDIAKRVHVSLSDISIIKRKITGEEIEKERRPLSIHSQALQLFKEGNSLIDFAIFLDMPKDEVIQNYSNYLILRNMKEVATILQE